MNRGEIDQIAAQAVARWYDGKCVEPLQEVIRAALEKAYEKGRDDARWINEQLRAAQKEIRLAKFDPEHYPEDRAEGDLIGGDDCGSDADRPDRGESVG